LIGDYTENITKEEFLNTNFIQDAVIRRIKIIGGPLKICPTISKANIQKFSGKQLQMTHLFLKKLI